MFGAPDPNGNMEREDSSDNHAEESERLSEVRSFLVRATNHLKAYSSRYKRVDF